MYFGTFQQIYFILYWNTFFYVDNYGGSLRWFREWTFSFKKSLWCIFLSCPYTFIHIWSQKWKKSITSGGALTPFLCKNSDLKYNKYPKFVNELSVFVIFQVRIFGWNMTNTQSSLTNFGCLSHLKSDFLVEIWQTPKFVNKLWVFVIFHVIFQPKKI